VRIEKVENPEALVYFSDRIRKLHSVLYEIVVFVIAYFAYPTNVYFSFPGWVYRISYFYYITINKINKSG